MNPDVPSSLYKYFAPERTDALSLRRLRYTPLGAFNDPFEGRPEIIGLSTPDETISIVNDLLPDETRRMYESLPPHVQAAIPFKQVYFMAGALAQSKQAEMHAAMQAITPTAIAFITRKLDEMLGALCLSEVPDSILMWSHYGASHSGFVLEFKGDHPHFHEPKTPDDDFRRLRRVLYRDTRPSSHLSAMGVAELFLVKSAQWSYEREWRIMRALSDAATVVPTTPYPVHLFEYPPKALKAVIVGARATNETATKIHELISATPDFAHVRVRRAVADSTHFHLRIVDAA